MIRASIRHGSFLALEIVNSGQLSAAPLPTIHADRPCERSRERLRLLYGEQATLHLENRDAATVAAMVSIPA